MNQPTTMFSKSALRILSTLALILSPSAVPVPVHPNNEGLRNDPHLLLDVGLLCCCFYSFYKLVRSIQRTYTRRRPLLEVWIRIELWKPRI